MAPLVQLDLNAVQLGGGLVFPIDSLAVVVASRVQSFTAVALSAT